MDEKPSEGVEVVGGTAPKVAVVILNWNGWRDTIECLESLAAQDTDDFYVIVVDNGSTNESLTELASYFEKNSGPGQNGENQGPWTTHSTIDGALDGEVPSWSVPPLRRSLVLLPTGENLGFSRGNNVGSRLAERDAETTHVLILNNDMVAAPDVLSGLLRETAARPSVGMAGGKIYYYHEPHRIWFGGGRISWLKGSGLYLRRDELEAEEAPPEPPELVSFLSGAALFVTREGLRKAGHLPEAYFMGGEESEYSIAISRAGLELLYVPQVRYWHKVGRSHDESHLLESGANRFDRNSNSFAYSAPRHIYHWYRYKLLFQRRNLPKLAYWAWYLGFRAYAVAATRGWVRASRRIPPNLRSRLYRAVFRDHARFDTVELSHLKDFERSIAGVD